MSKEDLRHTQDMQETQDEEQHMEKDKIRFIHDSLGEAKEFSKEVRQYLYEIEKQRPLTDMEKALWDKTHRIHVRTEDSRMMIQEQYEEVY